MNRQDNILMAKYDITSTTKAIYHYQNYHYENLADALAYAKIDTESKGLASRKPVSNAPGKAV